jgi:NADH-quinone oxidoreductase subunit N
VNEKPLALLPEALLLAGAISGLLLGLFLPRRRQWLVRVVASCALVASIAAALAGALDLQGLVFDGAYDVDIGTTVALRARQSSTP